MVVGWNRGMTPCCENQEQFSPLFRLTGLGKLLPHVEFVAENGLANHLFDTYRKEK